MEYEQPKPLELSIEVDCFNMPPVQIGEKILIVDDTPYYPRRRPSTNMAGILAMAGGISGLKDTIGNYKPSKRHEPHSGAKEKTRRLKQLVKRQAT